MIKDRLETSVRGDRRTRTALRLSLVAFVMLLFNVVVYLYAGLQSGAWQLYVLAALVGVMDFTCGIGLLLIRRNRANLGLTLYMCVIALLLPFTSLLITGLGLAIGFASPVAFAILSGETLPQKQARRLIAFGTASGVSTLLLDTFGPANRLSVPLIQTAVPVLIVAAMGVLLYFVLRNFNRYSLRARLTIGFLAVSLLAVVLFAFINIEIARSQVLNSVGAQLSSSAGGRARAIGDLVAREVHLLQGLALNKNVQDEVEEVNASYTGDILAIRAEIAQLDQQWLAAAAAGDNNAPLVRARLGNEIASELLEYSASFPENVEVFVTDRFGALVAASHRTSDYAQADEDWWRAAWNNGQGAIYVEAPELDESSRTFASTIAVPIYTHGAAERRVVGVLRTTLDFELINALLSAGEAETGIHAALLLYDPASFAMNLVAPGRRDLIDPDELKPLQTAAGGYAELTFQGVPSLAAQAPLVAVTGEEFVTDLGWSVVVHQVHAQALAPVTEQGRYLVLLSLLISGLAAGAALFVSQRLANPILRLTQVAEKVALGDLSVQAPVESVDEIGALATTFNSMTAQVRSLVGSLEQNVAARTEQLRASADVGRAAASILDPIQLIRQVVNLITDRFGFYYAAVFTLDETGKWAVLRDATGEAGRLLKERGHRLEVGGQSMVGYVTAHRRPRIALDVGEDAVRFANPLLPDTRSEIALPLAVGGQVLGALDVQSTQEAAFDESSAAVLQSMADQIAIALNNATSYSEAQAAVLRARALYLASQQVSRLDAELSVVADDMMRAVSEVLGYSQWWIVVLDERHEHALPLASTAPGRRQPVRLADQPNNPVFGSALHSETHLINDPEHDPRVSNIPAHRRVMSKFLSVPIVSRGESIGALTVGRSLQAPDLVQADVDVARSLAGLIALAIENRRLLEQSRQAYEEVDTLNRRLTGQAWRRFGRSRSREGVIRVGDSLEGEKEEPEEILEALQTGNVTARPARTPGKVGVAVPITLRGTPIGAIRLVLPERDWDGETAAMLESIAGHVAQASENARLIQTAEERAQRERALGEATDKIRRVTDIERVLQTAAEELARHLGASQVAARLGFADHGDGSESVSAADGQ